MKVLVLTEGGKNIGFGHITRCAATYEALQVGGIQPIFIINGDESALQQFKGNQSINLDWLNDTESLFSYVENADIVFVDSYLVDYDLCKNISKTAKTVVYFDDEMRMDYPEGFVVNGAISAEQMPYPERKGVIYLLGAQYAPLRREFWDVPAKSIRNNLETAMITFGGTDVCNLTPKILKLLVDAHPQLNKKVVIGKGFVNISEIESIKDCNTELIYYPDATGVRKVMLESDIAISAGGQTLYELARIGVPTIGICVAANQLGNIREWAETGFLKYIDSGNPENLGLELEDAIKYLVNKHVRMDMAAIGRKIIDGRGCNRIINKIKSDKRFEGQLN